MTTVTANGERSAKLFDDFFQPWSELVENGGVMGKAQKVPAVNIIENKEQFAISIAVPGMKKEDFKIEIEENMLIVSCETEENKEDKEAKYTRKEYNYSSFSRSFMIPEEVDKEKIDSKYEGGILQLSLPKKAGITQLAASESIAA